jgi:hypothetical protein
VQIVSINDARGNRSVSWSGQGGRSYTQQLRVITDDPTMGPRAVAKALGFKVGAQYVHPLTTTPSEWDYGNYLQGFDIKEEGDDGRQWLCTLNYGQFNWVEQGGATTEAAGEGQTDPFKVPVKVSFGTTKFERYCVKDIKGNPILNNVGDPFDPPIKRDDSRATITLVRNEPSFHGTYVQTFKDTVNADYFLGIYPANTVKCADVTAEREYQADWGYYWVVTYHFEIREFVVDAQNNIIYEGWTEVVLNTGLREYKDVFTPANGLKQIRIEGAPVTSPVMINVNGKYEPVSDPCYLRFQIYPFQDFNKFNFDVDLLSTHSIPGQSGS